MAYTTPTYPTYASPNNMGQQDRTGTQWGTGGAGTSPLTSNQAGSLTYGGGTNAWNNTDRSTSAWGSNNNTYSTNPVQPQGNPVNWNGSSGLPPSPPIANTTNADWWNNWNGGNYPSAPSAQTGQSNVPAGTTPQYGTNPVRPGTQATQGPGAGFTWSPPSWVQGLNQEGWGTPAMGTALQNYAQLQPWIQTQQNAYQYGQDFNENQRRWDQQFGQTQYNDQFNQNLAMQQQQMAQWVAQNQQQNWGQQFGFDQEMGRGQLAVAQQQNTIDEMFKRGQLTNEQYANESARLYQTGQLGIGNRELDVRDWYQRQQIANDPARLAQEGALTREGFGNQQQIAAMNAFGRAQRPQARFIRSW
jgi:hypothetical protein